MNRYKETIGNNIKKYREMSGIKQEELAERIGISQSTLSGYENGTREANYEKICLICKELSIEPNELFSLF